MARKKETPARTNAVRELGFGEAVAAHEAFTTLGALRLPLTLLLRLLPLRKELRTLADDYADLYNALLTQHAKRDKGKPVSGEVPGSVILKDTDAFNRDVETLNARRITLARSFVPLNADEIAKAVRADERALTLDALDKLGPFLV